MFPRRFFLGSARRQPVSGTIPAGRACAEKSVPSIGNRGGVRAAARASRLSSTHGSVAWVLPLRLLDSALDSHPG